MKKIYVDIGHGGTETGAVNTAAKEEDINLIVGIELARQLKDAGFLVKLSRGNNTEVSLAQRCNEANAWPADLFVSVHHNANDGRSDGYGIEHSINGGTGKQLAQYIAEEFAKIGQNKCMGVYSRQSQTTPGKDYLYTIRNTNMPAVTTEFAFMDSPDFSIVDTLQEQQTEATAIFKAIRRLYEFEWALGKIVLRGLIASPEYWDQNAQVGKTCDGSFVRQLIINIAKFC